MILVLILQFGTIPVLGDLYQRLELLLYDQRMQLHLPDKGEIDRRIVIVDIDEASLREQGRWPWSRYRIAELVKRLTDAGAVVVAFDVLFAEAERNPAHEMIERLSGDEKGGEFIRQLHRLAPQFDADSALARQMESTDVILGYTFNPIDSAVSGKLHTPLPLSAPELVQRLSLSPMAGYIAPLSTFHETARGSGFFSLIPDADGVVRRAPLLARYGDRLYASLALESVRKYLFLQDVTLKTALISGAEQIEKIHLDNSSVIPTDGTGRVLIPYRGKAGSFPYISAHKVLTGEYGEGGLAGAIVLVGTTASGMFDMRATPVGSVYPGVEVHANLIAAMLDNRYLVEPSWSKGANFIVTLILGLMLSLLMPHLSLKWLLFVTVTAIAILFSVTGWLWAELGLVLEIAAPLSLVLLLAGSSLVWGFFFESINRHRLKGMFGQYVPPELVDQMSERPEQYSFEGESRELSVLFSDIRGFTSISESLAAEELKRFLNEFFTPMTRIIFNQHGTIDKYVGDMVMAFWGAPVDDQEHAVHAIDAAMQMLKKAEEMKPDFARLGWPEVDIGIGINSGMMSVGDMGSLYRRAYTVLGDSVNLASRLEGATKYYGVGLVIGERTRELAGENFIYRELDLVRVKGKAEAIRVYQPVCRKDDADSQLLDEVASLEEAIVAYRERDWTRAEQLFTQLKEKRERLHLYSLYLDRISEFRSQDLGENWDGAYVRSEK